MSTLEADLAEMRRLAAKSAAFSVVKAALDERTRLYRERLEAEYTKARNA